MKREYYYLPMLVILFLSSCISTKEKPEKSYANNSEIIALIKSGVKEINNKHYSFDTIGNSLNKIFKYNNINKFILIQDSVDTKNGNVYEKYKVVANVNIPRDLYIFSICVLNKDTLIVNNKYENYHNLDTLIYIFNKTIVDKGLTERIISKPIIYFNTSKVREINFILKAYINAQKGMSNAEWKAYFISLLKIITFKKVIQNKIAISRFDKPFNELQPLQKSAITQLEKFSIILSFNLPCAIFKKPSKETLEDSIPIIIHQAN